MVVVSHLFLFLWKSLRGRFDSCESNLPLFGTMITKDYYNDFFEIGQQKINFSFFELNLPDDDPVYTLKKVMEELDFSGLLANCSDKGRTGFNPIMMYAVVTYANMRGVRAVDRIVELCERDLAFIWLTKGQKPKRDQKISRCGKKSKYSWRLCDYRS